METSWKGLLYFYKQASSLMGYQTNHTKYMFCLITPTLVTSQTKSDFVLW